MKMLHHLPSVKRLPKDFYKAYGLTRIPIHGDGNCFVSTRTAPYTMLIPCGPAVPAY